MFMFVFFFFTFFSSTFFATIDSLNKRTRSTSVVLGMQVNYLETLKKQYQEIEDNRKVLEELSTKCEHVEHTLEYYITEVSSIINSEKNQDTKTSKIQNLLHDGSFILYQLDDYLN